MHVLSTVISEPVQHLGSGTVFWGKRQQDQKSGRQFKRRRGKGEIKGLISDFCNCMSCDSFCANSAIEPLVDIRSG